MDTNLVHSMHTYVITVSYSFNCISGFILDAVGDSNHLFFIFGSCGLISGFLALTLVIAKFCYRRSHKSDCIEAIAVIPDQKHNAKLKV